MTAPSAHAIVQPTTSAGETTSTGASVPEGATTSACCPGQVTDQVLSAQEASSLATSFKALADPVRLQLVSLVASAASGEVCACDLPEAVDRSQSTVSHHLSILVDAGILAREQRGRWAWFSARHDTLAALADGLVTASPS